MLTEVTPLSLLSSTWTVFWVPFLPSRFTGVELCKSGLLAAECSQRPIHKTMGRKERKGLACLNCFCLHSQPDVPVHCDRHNGSKGFMEAKNKSKWNKRC